MKVKNINVAELHAEKIALGVGVLFLVAVVVYFLVLGPYTVEVSGRGEVSLPEAERLKQQALRTARQAQNTPQDLEGMLPKPPSGADFLKLELALAQTELDVPLGQAGLDPRDLAVQSRNMVQFDVPAPPAPSLPRAKAEWVVLQPRDEMVAQLIQVSGEASDRRRADDAADAYRRFVPEAVPRDTQLVTVMATFEVHRWLNALATAAPGTQLPAHLRRAFITDVVLERQEYDAATGQWGPSQMVPPQPGTISADVRPMDRQRGADVGDLSEFIRREDVQSQIARPAPAMVTADRSWFPPNVETPQLTEEEERELNQLQARLRSLELQIQQATREREPTAPVRPEQPTAPIGERPRPTTRPGTTETTTPRTTGQDPRLAARLEQLRRDRDALLQREAELLGQAAPTPGAMGPDAMVQPPMPLPRGGQPDVFRPMGPGMDAIGPRRPTTAQPEIPREIEVWAHDWTAEPGKTYRYRLRVHLLNPLFGFPALHPEQAELGRQLSLPSPPSEWTGSVATEPTIQYFIVGVDRATGTVDAELYRMVGGRRVMQLVRGIAPGDPIVGVTEVEYNGFPLRVPLVVDHLAVNLEERPTPGGGPVQHVFVFLDGATGDLGETFRDQDENSPTRFRLNNEWQRGQPVRETPGAPRFPGPGGPMGAR